MSADGGWTIESLKEHLESLIDAVSERLTTAIEDIRRAAERSEETASSALAAAKEAQDRRLDGLNELRAMLETVLGQTMPRAEIDSRIDTLTRDVRENSERIKSMAGRSQGLNAGWVYLIGAISLASVLVSLWTMLLK